MSDGERSPPWVAVSLECLIDPRPAVLWVIHSLSNATPEDVAELEATGEYDDPWLLARVANCWVRARRPRPIPSGWRVVVNACGGDPGDLTIRAARMYDHLGWRREKPTVDPARLAVLDGLVRLAVVTDREAAGLAKAQEVLGFTFSRAVTSEQARRPDAAVLKSIGETGHFLGKGPRDRACAEAARFAFHEMGTTPAATIEKLITRLTPVVSGT